MRHIREGVRLTPIKSRMFDVIKRAGKTGIATDDLIGIVYEGRDEQPTHQAVRSHVWQLNDALSDAKLAVRGRGGVYKLEHLS
jgi:hypothetical protein